MLKITLKECCNIITGKLDSNAAEKNGKYPYFTCAPEPLRINTFAYDEDAILLAGNNAAGNFHCQRYNGKFNAYQRTYIITAKEGYDIDFIFYNLLIDLNNFKRLARGSQTKFLTIGLIEDFAIPDIPLHKQISNRKILSLIDEKIRNNNRINDNLHQMIYDIYMKMFLHKEKNAILSDILIENCKSKTQVNEVKDFVDGNYPFFTSGDSILKSNKYLVDGRNIFMNTGGNADVKFYVGKTDYSTDTWCIKAKDNYTDYLFLHLLSIKPELDVKYFKGTSLKHLQKNLLRNKPIYIPSNKEIVSFNEVAVPYFNKISENIKESEKLIKLRDFLLPLLMNGQVSIA